MGEVVAVIKVMPESPDAFDGVKAEVEKSVKAEKIEEEPIAFGLKALKVTVVVKDDEGGTEAIEEKLKQIQGVSDVQVVDLGRL